jgi:hypothetical protein
MMEFHEFKAKFVSFQNEDGIVVVGFADDEFQTTQYVLLQRTLEPDEQDRKLGHDKVHVELDSQNRSGYGGIERIQMEGSALRFALNAKGSKFLGTPAISINLDDANVDYGTLKEYLSVVAGDESILSLK